jgi:hypothetical protein
VIVYLVGPSGVGKSNAVFRLRTEHPELAVLDLDEDFNGRESDWGAIGPRLSSLHEQGASSSHVVVDVGAGTQTRPELTEFLRHLGARVLLVTAPPEQVILRQPLGGGRDPVEFEMTEYTTRRELFSLASVAVDVTGLTQDEAAGRVAVAVISLLEPSS